MPRKLTRGGDIFKKLVKPYLKKAAKSGGNFKGVLKGEIHEIAGVKVVDNFVFTKQTKAVRNKLRRQFNRSERKKFLKGLNEADLRRHGFTDAEIKRVQSGKVPKGYQVHHKNPLDDSGTNNPDNLVLIRNSPDHQLITNHQTWATKDMAPGDSRTITWPEFPPGTTIWPPTRWASTTITYGPFYDNMVI